MPEVRDEADRHRGTESYVCPMHADVISDTADKLPQVRHEATPGCSSSAQDDDTSTRARAPASDGHEHDHA